MSPRIKKAALWGALFGFIAPFVGMFVGLQVSPLIANILMFPVLGIAFVIDKPIGMWSPWFILLGLVISIVVWALTFAAIASIRNRFSTASLEQ